jgi:hypothetical protein
MENQLNRKLDDDWCRQVPVKTLEEACDALRDYLQQWYQENKHRRMYPHELADKKREFMEASPDVKAHEFDIHFDFVAVPGSGYMHCGCCGESELWLMNVAKHRGIVVEPINWQKVCQQANFEYTKDPQTLDSLRKKYKENGYRTNLELKKEYTI